LYDGSGSSGGFITNSSAIILSATNSALDLTGNSDANGNLQTLTLYGGQTLSGFGSVTGLVATLSGSIVSPGSASKVGTLTVTGNPGSNSLSGALLLRLNRTNAQNCSTLAFASGTVTYAGTLSVSNIGPALQVGDVFHLFPSAANGFSAINLATTDSHLFSYTWQNNVAANGSITVASVQPPVGTNILFNVSSNILTLSWPTDHLGWILQSQTNNLAGTNWVNVAGSALVTSTNLTIGGTNNAVFYRMISPP